jgi:predicted ATP-grasp superfamily ATP-dependent carboligase
MLRCFAGTGISTLAIGSDPDSAIFFSRHANARRIAADPSREPDLALRDIAAIGRVFAERPALFHGSDAELTLLSKHREELARHYRLILPDPELTNDLLDEVRFSVLAEKLGLPTPRTLVAGASTTAREIVRAVGLPCVLKRPTLAEAAWTRGGLSEHGRSLVAHGLEDLDRALGVVREFASSFVAQEYLDGDSAPRHSVVAYVRSDKKPLGHFVIREVLGPRRRASHGARLELADEPSILRVGLDLLERLGLSGIARLDLKLDETTGTWRLIGVRARFGFWLLLGAAARVNLPLLAYRDVTGAAIEPQTEPSGRDSIDAALRRGLARGATALRPAHRPHADASGLVRAPSPFASLRTPSAAGVFSWDDPSPFVMRLLQGVRVRAPGRRG